MIDYNIEARIRWNSSRKIQRRVVLNRVDFYVLILWYSHVYSVYAYNANAIIFVVFCAYVVAKF